MINGHTETKKDELQLIQIKTLDELLSVWPFVKKGIEHIKDRDKSCGTWTAGQIFNAVKFGLPTAPQKTTAVELFVGMDGDTKLRGFMVTTPRLDPFMNNTPCGIHVWLLYSETKWNIVASFLPQLERLGKVHGGDQIRFESGRWGWCGRVGKLLVDTFGGTKLGRLGFRVHQVVFVKDIQW